MACFLCNKTYSRLTQHMAQVHKINGVNLEPQTLDQYLFMVSLIPSHISSEEHEIVMQHLKTKKELPSNLYAKLVKNFNEYKDNDGKMKLSVTVGKREKKSTKK